MENVDLCTQVLFKKYSTQHPWLAYNDLRRIVEKFSKDPINDNFNGQMSAELVRNIHNRVYPVIEKIHLVKSVRNLKVEANVEQTVEPEQEKPKISHDTLTPSLNYKVHYVLMDSKDRNTERWPLSNPFQFSLGPSSVNLTSVEQHNAVYRSFADVHAVTVKKVILPEAVSGLYPYLLIVINEFGPNINGTNDEMNAAYGHLTDPSVVGKYAHYNYDESFETLIEMGRTNHMTKIFTPRIEISKLTFCIQTPDGTTLEMHENTSVIIELQVICLKKELENTMLLRPG